MIEFNIVLKPEEIENFVRDLRKIPFDIDAICSNNRIVVDAKSVLGMHAIYQNGRFRIIIHTDEETDDIVKLKKTYNCTN